MEREEGYNVRDNEKIRNKTMEITITLISLIRQCLTCLIAVTVITKNKGRPLVTGLVGVSTITC